MCWDRLLQENPIRFDMQLFPLLVVEKCVWDGQRNTRPGHPWLSRPGIWVRARWLYGNGPNRCEKYSIARAAVSPMTSSCRAGEGREGAITCGVRGIASMRGGSITLMEAEGEVF